MHRSWRRISALLLLLAAGLAGCGSSSAHTASTAAAVAHGSDRACLQRFNASRQAEPFAVMHLAITGGYVASDETLAYQHASCGVLLFIRLIPHHRIVPMLFLTTPSSRSWRRALPRTDPLGIGNRARIPGGMPVDVADPLNLLLEHRRGGAQ